MKPESSFACSQQPTTGPYPEPDESRPHITDWLTSWSRVLQKLTVTQPVKQMPAFYGTRKFITMFTTARHWSLSWVRCIQSTSSHPISLRPTAISPSYARPRFPTGHFLLGFHTDENIQMTVGMRSRCHSITLSFARKERSVRETRDNEKPVLFSIPEIISMYQRSSPC
jgi:hypothetical protein